MRGSFALPAIACALALAVGCGGADEPRLRIGIVTDCYGIFGSGLEPTVAAASLPLIERGATLVGRRPSEGVESVTVGARRVELLLGCAEGTSPLLSEARRLVEVEGVRVLVGPLTAENGLALREYARRRPETTFVMMPSPAQGLTLSNPLPNVFRFQADGAQSMAGLGGYAYHRLGWRKAVVVADDVPFGWEQAAGLVAEFCALGGRVLDRLWIPPQGADAAMLVPRIPRDADGVFLAAGIAPLFNFVDQYARRRPELAKNLVGGAILLLDPEIVTRLGPRLRGTVVGSTLPLQPTARSQAYAAAFARAFPSLPVESAFSPIVLPYRDGVAAVLGALERVEGELSEDGATIRQALGEVTLDSPVGRIRLDVNRQAVAPIYLSRLQIDAAGKPQLRTFRILRDVEQTFGGYFRPNDPMPGRTSPECRRGNPPPWARE